MSNQTNSTANEKKYLSDGDFKRTGSFDKSIFKTLNLIYSPFFKRIVFCLSLGFLGRLLLLGNTNIIGLWVDSITGKQNVVSGYEPLQIVSAMGIMALIGFFLTVIFRISFSRMSAQAVSTFYDEVTLRTSRAPMSFFDNTPAGRIMTRFSSDYGNIFRLLGGPVAEFISIVFELVIMVILITVANPIYLIFVGIIVFLNAVIYQLNKEKLRTARRELSASRSPSIAHFAETTQGASTIRTFRRQKSFADRFEKLDHYFLAQKMKTVKQLISFSFQMNSLTAFLLLFTGVAAYFLVEKGWASIGSVGVAFAFITLSGNTVQMFFEWLTQFEEAMIGVERLDNYMRMPIEPGSRLPSYAKLPTGHPVYSKNDELNFLKGKKITSEKNASVEVKDLWFRYNDHLPWVLKGVSFKVNAGERLGIVGRTGSGKSSLIQALFQLYPIDKGAVYLADQAPSVDYEHGIDLNIYRKSMAFIAQEPVLFLGSLRFNLDIENKYSDDDLYRILNQVGLKEWVQMQPGQLNMKVEERGKNLSLGERQLLCMARCLLQEAPIVIMDEATSSVDPQSEEILVRATEEFFSERTQIIIAHRLSTLEKCDRILWLQNGEIKALGPTAEILPKFKSTELV